MTGIGPVEPHEPPDAPSPQAPPPPADTLGDDARRLSDRWTELPPHRRRLAVTAAATLVALAACAVLLTRPEPAPTRPSVPWPAQVTHLRYNGTDTRPGTFRFTVRVDRGTSVTIHQVLPGFGQLTAATTPRPPFTVAPGIPRALAVRIGVRDCTALPRLLDMTYLDLSLHNRRGQELHSFIFVGRYPHALLAHLRATCGPPVRHR
ncbi:hypothetical protein ACVHNB_30405 [Streptomyces sp. YJ-C3]